jgi:hypothetical protein
MYLSFLGTPNFNMKWLDLLRYDPVHPGLSIQNRISGNRTVVFAIDNSVPQFAICIRIGNKLPKNMEEILEDDEWVSKYDINYAVLYSIFKLPSCKLRKVGPLVIKNLLIELKRKRVERVYTLSPISLLSKNFKQQPNEGEVRKYLEQWLGPVEKFHLSNGARIHSINFNGDKSEIRQLESWGIMVNYDYNG